MTDRRARRACKGGTLIKKLHACCKGETDRESRGRGDRQTRDKANRRLADRIVSFPEGDRLGPGTGLPHSSGGFQSSSSRDRESGRRDRGTEAERGAESMALVALSLWVLTSLTWGNLLQVSANRHSVYWNSSNIQALFSLSSPLSGSIRSTSSS
ncbi:hypothetical protein PAMP_003099 [Pampus punctatissimus]